MSEKKKYIKLLLPDEVEGSVEASNTVVSKYQSIGKELIIKRNKKIYMKRISRGSSSWTDDVAYEEERMREFLRQREAGTLLSQRVTAKQLRHNHRMALTPVHPDGNVRFGDLVMVQSAETRAFLSVDLDDIVQEVPLRKIGVTTAFADYPQNRNVWRITRVEGASNPLWIDQADPDVLHYGQKFMLQLNPDLSPDLYLHSELKSLTAFSKISHLQEVCVTDKCRSSMVWVAVYGGEQFRFEMEGQCVKANAPLQIHHVATNMPMASTKTSYPNDFGAEFEVACSRPVPPSRQGLVGRDQHFFVFVTAPPDAGAVAEAEQ